MSKIKVRNQYQHRSDYLSYAIGQLQEGTVKVRQVLGPDLKVTDEEIQESLWHYYYDVEKTVNYILSTIELQLIESLNLIDCRSKDWPQQKSQ